MIVGIGLDITALPRIASILERWGERFLQRILTEKERAALPPGQGRRTAWVAGRFAAKEAASKALGTGFSGGVEMRDIEILTMEGGAPRMILHGGAEARARALGARSVHVSISHEKDMACAVAILENGK
ncbi:MAG: holo-ACP synthase [Desulfovibrio sp.]|jgi:holo-[acyl-carrier protein] synthase|nr:holo-ACP synthase [Mailhella sp.]